MTWKESRYTMNTRSIAKTAAAMLASAAMIGVGAVTASGAYAVDGAGAGSPAQIVIHSPQAVNDDASIAPSLDGRSFSAYLLGTYEDVTVNADGSAITGYSIRKADGIDPNQVMGWINKAAGGTTPAGLSDVMTCNGTGCSFKGAAENLTPLQFVSRYFYGSGADAYGNEHADQPLMRKFAQAAAQSGSLKTPSANATGADGEAVFSTLPAEGLYLVTENPSDATSLTDAVIARAMVTGTAYTQDGKTYDTVADTSTDPATTFTLGELYLKAEKVIVSKNVTDADGTTVADQLAQTSSSRTFTIAANVPLYDEYSNWTSPKFSISDAPANLTLDAKSIVVRSTDPDAPSTPTTLTAGSDYTVTTTDGGFTVTLDNPGALSGATVRVTYTGTVTDASVDTTANTTTVRFSNSPSDDSALGNGHVEATKNVYTAAIPLQKIKYNAQATVLPGAEFTVTGANGNPVCFDKNADGTVYTMRKRNGTDTNPGTATITSNGSSIQLAGLGADTTDPTTYTFTETKAPTGYILGKTPVTFTLTVTPQYGTDKNAISAVAYKINGNPAKAAADFSNFVDLSDAAVIDGTPVTAPTTKTVTGTDGAKTTVNTTEYRGGMIRVENTTNADDFAKTGGQITLVLAVVAALAVVGAACLVVARARRNRA